MGEPFLGRKTARATAVLLTEENNQQLHEKAARFGVLDSEHRYLGRSDGVLQLDWETLITHATTAAIHDRHRLLVIDTFPGLAGLEAEETTPAQSSNASDHSSAPPSRTRGPVPPPHQQDRRHPRLASLRCHRRHQRPPRPARAAKHAHPAHRAPRTHRRASQAHRATAQEPRRLVLTSEASSRVGKRPNVDGSDWQLEEALLTAGPRGLTYRGLGQLPGLSIDKAKKRLPKWEIQGRVRRRATGKKGDPNSWITTNTK